MPELPEVETIRRSLAPLVGRRIARLELSPVAPLRHCGAHDITARAGATITDLARRGKFLLLRLEHAPHLLVHLGMSGRLRHVGADEAVPPHTHLRLRFADDTELRYIDPRRFGGIGVCNDPTGADFPSIAQLGPEFDDADFTPSVFVARCRRHQGLQLKALTLNQHILAGLGNIYACEALYHARLRPTRVVRDTTDAELARLLGAAQHALRLGIAYGGTTLKDYVDGLGHRGTMQDFLHVYDREGRTTPDGHGPVERIVQHGRSTWWCPNVQI